MIGMLGENKDTIRQTIAFAKELDLDTCGFSVTRPLPGTELYDAAVKSKLIQVEETELLKDWMFDVTINLTENCSNEELVTFENEAFREFTVMCFGWYFMFNPVFLKKVAGVFVSLRSRGDLRELTTTDCMFILLYWHKTY